MLRILVLGLGGICSAIGALAVAVGAWGGLWLLGFGLLILLGTLFERRYHRNLSAPPGDGWLPTGERFKDPTTGEALEVWYSPHNGERRYVKQ